MKNLFLNKYDENEFIEILTYLYEIPKFKFGNKGWGFSYNPIEYYSILKPQTLSGIYNTSYHYIKNSLNIYKIENLLNLNPYKFSVEKKQKPEFYLYNKISYSNFKKINFNKSIFIKDFNKNNYYALPEKITHIEDLPQAKAHKTFLEYYFPTNHQYRNLNNIHTSGQRRNYLSEIKKMNKSYESYLKKYSQNKKLFENNDTKKFKEILFNYEKGSTDGIFNYLKFIISHCCFNTVTFPRKIIFKYNKKEKRLLISLQLPDFDRVKIKERRIKKGNPQKFTFDTYLPDKIISKSEHNKIAENSLYLIPIKIIYEFFHFDYKNYFNDIAINGIVNSYNKANGRLESNNILSLFVERKKALKLNLSKVNPKECFRGLKGISASKIYENIAINPILTFDKDSRIIKSKPVLDNVSEENLAVMPWDDFEHLIRELFAKRFSKDGEEVKITQSSRDRGVDAIAYDPDPIRGGKYIIQAKRYTATVDVSAVRDLYGTIHNEGANRGILVTTASYGSDAYNFAKDKNISLINGSELLGLLNEHGYNNFKIDIKEARKTLNLTPKKSY